MSERDARSAGLETRPTFRRIGLMAHSAIRIAVHPEPCRLSEAIIQTSGVFKGQYVGGTYIPLCKLFELSETGKDLSAALLHRSGQAEEGAFSSQ